MLFSLEEQHKLMPITLHSSLLAIPLSLLAMTVALNENAFATSVNCNEPPRQGVDWSGCDLSNKDLTNLDLVGANLSNANLSHANLTNSMLNEANLQGVDLHGADFHRMTMYSANLQNANLSEVNFQGSSLHDSNFEKADLQGANLDNAEIWSAKLTYVNLQNAHLRGANLIGANLSHANLSYASLNTASLNGANLSYATMQNTDLSNTTMNEANLTGAMIQDLDLRGSNVQEATQNGKKLPPLKQMAYGRLSDQVACPVGFVLLKKPTTDSLACVKPASVHKLIQRNWNLVDKTIVILTEGSRYGPLLVQEIHSYRIGGTQFSYAIFGETKAPITLQLGEKVTDMCYGSLFFLTVNDSGAIFSKGGGGICPVCLSGHTLIDTPVGAVNIKELKDGMPIWTLDNFGHKQSAIILKTGKMFAPSTHKMVQVVLDHERELYASPRHPTADGRLLGELKVGDVLDGATITSVTLVPYDENYTYDILPSGPTGFYWANGILVGSTLKK